MQARLYSLPMTVFYIFWSIWLTNFVILSNILGSSSSSSSSSLDILDECHLYCKNNYNTESKTEQKSLCDKECKLKNCRDGCQLYREALHSSCYQLCYNPQHQGDASPGLRVKEKSCETGCTQALNLYEKQKSDELENATLPAPEITRYNVTHSSVHLLWKSDHLVSNITYMIQMKMPEISEVWELWNSTELHQKPFIHFIVNDLHPYTTYQFSVIAYIKMPDRFLVSNESVSVLTLSHGKPSSVPKISSVATPSPTVITIIWNPPLYPNGRVTGYKLTLSYVKQRTITREVSEHTHSWSFSQLQHSKKYTLKVLAWNAVGEGPVDTHIITTPDLMLEAEIEKPYLVLAANNMILKQNLLDVFTDPVTLHQVDNRSITVLGFKVLYKSKTGLIQDIGLSIKNHLVLFSDSHGSVHVIFTNSSKQKENIYPAVKNPQAITVDWLHNKAYIAGDQEIYQCLLPPNYDCLLAVKQLHSRPSDIKVDPINGFLYFTQSGETNGIFRVDLADIESGKNIPPLQIVKNKQDTFTIDFENIQLYFPNSSLNTIMSTFLDGEGLSNIRPNVAKANFNNIKSIVSFNGSFIWTDGQKVLKEVYDQHGDKYHYNAIHFKESPFSGFNTFHSSAQPMPVPTNPPSNLAVLFSDTTADIRWNKPEKLIYQGNGCWRSWKYEMTIQQGDAKNLTTYNLEGFNLTLDNLKPDTKYTIKMRAYIDNKYGPWAEKFVGYTLFKDNVKPIVTYHTRDYTAQIGLDGRTLDGRLLDGENDEQLRIIYHKQRGFYIKYPHISAVPYKTIKQVNTFKQFSALSIAVDWLSKKIYWSSRRFGIRRVDESFTKMDKINNDEAYNLCIDSLQGILYWNTKYSVHASNLNGRNTHDYYRKPFQEKPIIAMTINMDSYILYWIQPTTTGTKLFMADMIGYKNQNFNGQLDIVHLESKMYQLQYFSHRFVWLNREAQLVVSDLRGRNSSSLVNSSHVRSFSLFHPSQHRYPDGLNENTTKVVPNNIPNDSIRVEGNWSNFNITWREASEVNYGEVRYVLTLKVQEFRKYNKGLDTEQNWYSIRGMPPYTEIHVFVKALTCYGSSKTTSVKIRSPMSVPNEPLNPRVYINERKELQSSEEFLSADLRWSVPNNRFGVLDKYKVFYKTDSNSSEWNIEPHTRQFVVERLGANCTYTFMIQACTIVACSKMSVSVSITSNNTKPLPELLIASEEGIKLAEVDNDLKISEKISFKGSTRAFTFLAKDNSFFWINDGSTLIMRNNKMEKIMLKQFKKEVNDLTVDWIDHTLYIAAGAEIQCYNIYIKAPCVLRHGNGVIYSVKVSPFTSTLFWTETEDLKSSRVFKSRTDGSDVIEILPAQRPRLRKRSPKEDCQCPTDVEIDSTLGVDYTNDNIYFVDLLEKSLWRTDSDGCQCQKLFTQTSNEFESLNSLTTDYQRVYWSNKNNNDNDNNIYSVRKRDGKYLRINQVPNVNKIVAFGSHLQPLPDLKCLMSLPKDKSITVFSRTNTSITLRLSDIERHPDCEAVSRPTTNYTVHYTELMPGMDDDASCAKKNIRCHTVESFQKKTVIYPLKPYTNYLFQVAVSNIYTDYRADVLSLPLINQTLAGAPSSIRSLEAFTLTYEDIKISWRPPLQPNGNESMLVYVVTSTTTQPTGEILNKTVQLRHGNIYNRGLNTLEYTLPNLKPEHEYKIQVKACDSKMKWCSNSLEATNKTAKNLSPIKFHNVTATSITVSWTTPADTPIHTFLLVNKNTTSRRWSAKSRFILQPPLNQTNIIFFDNLQPNILYEFAVRIVYHNHNIQLKKHWPHINTSIVFALKTLVEFPSPPMMPYVRKLNSGYEVTWKNPDEKVPPNLYELQYKPAAYGNWTTIYNDSAPNWIIEENVLDGENYIFRVKSRNSRGWSDFGKSSRPFIHQIDRPAESNVYQYVIIPITLFIVIIILILICILFKKKQTEKKRITHVNDGHNPDVELATLQDLPHIAVQQNNTLYSVGMVPTDADLIALPHFRHDQLIRKKFLGSGAFGEVFEGVCKSCVVNGETRVAVKTLRKCASGHEKEEFLKEALLMSNFKHEHILRLLGVCFDGNPQFIVLELMEGGDLLLYLRNYRPSSTSNVALTLLDLMKVCVHVSRGCKYLEEMHFVHRDLAARNCLVSSKNPRDMVVKIGDFGLARDIYKNDYYRKEGEGLLPVRWMSPESLVDGVFTTQSDVWSFGVLVWEVITYGQQPYPARTNLEVLQYVRSGGRLDRPDNCPDYLYQLKLNCWSYAPEDRPTSSFILEQLELFYQKLFEESMLNKNTTNSTTGTENDEKLGIAPNAENYIMTDTDMGHSRNRIPKSSIGSEFTAEDDPTPLLEDDNTSTNTSDYLEPSKLETPKYLELISDKPNATAGKQVVRGARPKTNSTSSFNSPPQLPDKCHQNGAKPNNNNNNENLTNNGSTKSKGSTGARRNFQGLHYAQLATCSTDSSVDESDDESCTEMNYITPQVSMSCTLLNQVQNEPGHQRHLSKQTSAPAPLHNNSLSNEGIWVNSGSMDNQNSNNYLFHNSCASPTKLQVWADKNRNLVSKNSAVLAISDCPEYINTPQPNSLNYPSGKQTATGTPIFSSQPTLV